jgi:hypothetical protein
MQQHSRELEDERELLEVRQVGGDFGTMSGVLVFGCGSRVRHA